MLDLAMALFLALIAAGIGKRLLDWLGQSPDHPLDTLALAAPLGLGILALAALLIGEAGWLNLVGLAVLLGVATELGVLAGARLASELVPWLQPGLNDGADRVAGAAVPTQRLDRLIFLFLVLVLVATALAALAPVTDGDALCYHLQVPKVFLIRQAVYFDPDLHETVYPLVTELLYAIALEFRGPVACRCLHWVLGLVFAANVAALARPSLGRRAWWAAALAVLVPAISNGMAAPLNDVSLAAFGAAAIFAWIRAIDRPTLASTILAGVYSGLAMGVKYPALVLVALLATGHSRSSAASIGRAILQGHGPRAWAGGGIHGSGDHRRRRLVPSRLRPDRQSGLPVLQDRLRRRRAGGGSGPDQAAARHGALGTFLGHHPSDSGAPAV